MPRMSRAVVPGVAHHLTQRGVDRQDVFTSDDDRQVYLRLAAWAMRRFEVQVLAYCLMSNHVHWVVVPPAERSLARAFGWLHGRYAQHFNAAQVRSGHLWQNRFFSCALDEPHTWAAVRYVERNPVRAAMVERAEQWIWSSAAQRLRLAGGVLPLHLMPWRERFTLEDWLEMLRSDSLGEADLRLRVNTYTGRVAGSEEFVRQAEEQLKRRLATRKGGRHAKTQPPRQLALFAGK